MAQTKNRTKITYEVLRSRAATTFNGTYQTLGAVLAFPARIVKIKNLTNQTVTLSTDGTNPHDIFLANTGDVMDLTANGNTDEPPCFAAGTQFYVNAPVGTGTIYLVAIYTA
ncbi:MAG TPA: hypothetical protein VKZ95_01380 [Sphingobacteriaceae bacterium]|nr:hypothetical protein [Sphingobacteriaceae bacterium]